MVTDDEVSLCNTKPSFLIQVTLKCDTGKVTDAAGGGFPFLLDLDAERSESSMDCFNAEKGTVNSKYLHHAQTRACATK